MLKSRHSVGFSGDQEQELVLSAASLAYVLRSSLIKSGEAAVAGAEKRNKAFPVGALQNHTVESQTPSPSPNKSQYWPPPPCSVHSCLICVSLHMDLVGFPLHSQTVGPMHDAALALWVGGLLGLGLCRGFVLSVRSS